MDKSGKIAVSLCAFIALGAFSSMMMHSCDRDENHAIEQNALCQTVVLLSKGKAIDPTLAYRVDTMKRLNAKGTWLTQNEVRQVIDLQAMDYLKALPSDMREWSVQQKLVYDYAISTVREFEKNPDKTKFREQIRQDLKNMGVSQNGQTAPREIEKGHKGTNMKAIEIYKQTAWGKERTKQ